MSREVRERICPTCGTDHHEVKTWQIPEVSVVEKEAVEKLGSRIGGIEEKIASIKLPEVKIPEVNLQPLQADLATLKEAVNKAFFSHIKPSVDLVKSWEDCPDCKNDWAKIRAGIAGETKKQAHPVFNDEYLAHLESCPTCKSGFDKFKQDLIAEAKKAEEPIKPVESAKPLEPKDKTWWGKK